MIELSSVDDVLEKIEQDRVVLFFYSTNCGPCRQAHPHFEKYSKENFRISFYQINVDIIDESLDEFSVRLLPTSQYYSKGQLLYEFVGFPQQKVEYAISKLNKI